MLSRLAANGCEIAFRLEGPAHAPVVIFASGLGMDTSMWSPQLASFTAGYRVLRYDLRGHGGSSSTPGDYSLSMLALDIIALMDALDIPAAHLVGTSLGAMVGLQLAIDHPGRLLSLTLCATTVEPPREAWRSRIEASRLTGIAPQADGIVGRWFLPSFALRQPGAFGRMRAILCDTKLDGYLGCAAAIRDMDVARSLSSIAVPALVVAGECDLVTPRRDLEHIAALIPGAQLVDIAGCAHLPTIEQPEACNRAILSFLDTIGTPVIAGAAEGEQAAATQAREVTR